jgi:hypothetical protein
MSRATASIAWATACGLIALASCTASPSAPTGAREEVGAAVAVYQAPLEAPPAANRMPAGCREVGRGEVQKWTEQQMAGVADPYRKERASAARAGGNVLLVLSKQISSRRCPECPLASPITDCPLCEGAWFAVVFVSYACSAEALASLPPQASPR